MSARPILFSAPMIRALLDGRKSETRRALKTQPLDILPMPKAPGREWVILEQREPESRGKVIRCRFGVPGDYLWVRETHAIVGNVDPGWVLYRASGYESECRRYGFDGPPPESEITWKPSIHMPRWASRLTLRITEIRVQRLQEISEEDAIAEGVTMPESEREERDFSLCSQCGGTLLVNRVNPSSGGMMFDSDCRDCETARDRYRHLWNYINGPDGWTTNPWCWALTFSVIQANVDEVLRRKTA